MSEYVDLVASLAEVVLALAAEQSPQDWIRLALEAGGVVWGGKITRLWQTLGACLGLLVVGWKKVFPPDPLLVECLEAVASPGAAFTIEDGILVAEPLACQMGWDMSGHWFLCSANLAGREVTKDMLGERGWRRLERASQCRVAELDAPRIEAVRREVIEHARQKEEAKKQATRRERDLALQAARKARQAT